MMISATRPAQGLIRTILPFVLVLFMGACRNGERLRSEVNPGPAIGTEIPTLDLHDLDGQPVDLAEFAGRVVVLNLWATWCVPCRDEMPELQELQERHDPDALVVVGLSIDEGGAALVTVFLEEFGITYPNFMAVGGPLLETLDLYPGVPHTLLLDRAGTIRGYWSGRFDPLESSTEDLIERILSDDA